MTQRWPGSLLNQNNWKRAPLTYAIHHMYVYHCHAVVILLFIGLSLFHSHDIPLTSSSANSASVLLVEVGSHSPKIVMIFM